MVQTSWFVVRLTPLLEQLTGESLWLYQPFRMPQVTAASHHLALPISLCATVWMNVCEAGIHRLEVLHSNLHLASQLQYWQQLWHLRLEWHLLQLWSSVIFFRTQQGKALQKIIPPENFFLDLSACAVNFCMGHFVDFFADLIQYPAGFC